jgi:hypothetical protein
MMVLFHLTYESGKQVALYKIMHYKRQVIVIADQLTYEKRITL